MCKQLMVAFQSVLVLLLMMLMISSCASTKGYYGRSEANVAVVSSQKHKVTIGKKSSWEIAYLCKVDDKVVGNYFKGYPSKCKVIPGRRTIEVAHHQQWNYNFTGVVLAGAMFGAIGGTIAAVSAGDPYQHYAITFDVEQGRSYLINVETVTDSDCPTFSVVDSDSGDLVSMIDVVLLAK